ncbi:MAG: hypothetical protein ACAI38_07885 [Myxococcota bacterium]|nr:hypothetical protein [Myxococcota bacterium]
MTNLHIHGPAATALADQGKVAPGSAAPAPGTPQMQAPRRYIVKVDDSEKDGPNVYYVAITNPRPGEEIFHGEFAPYVAETGDGKHTSGFETRYRPLGPITSEPFKGNVETF